MGAPVTQQGNWQAGATATSAVLFTRPADSTQYTAGDVVSTSTTTAAVLPLEFKNAARGMSIGGIIQSAVFIDSAAGATKPDLELYLFDTPIAMQADNAAWAPSSADLLRCVGVVAFPTGAFKTGSSNGIIASTGLGSAFTCSATSTSLYGVLVVRNGYTPASGEIFEIRLQILQD